MSLTSNTSMNHHFMHFSNHINKPYKYHTLQLNRKTEGKGFNLNEKMISIIFLGHLTGPTSNNFKWHIEISTYQNIRKNLAEYQIDKIIIIPMISVLFAQQLLRQINKQSWKTSPEKALCNRSKILWIYRTFNISLWNMKICLR